MERTESTVVQVSPSYENDKIQEMQAFGWNLQGRQEIHEEGDAYGRPSFTDSSTYIVKTKVKHYVKLHFARPLNLPNVAALRQLESEYSSLPFPAPPALGWPVGLTLLCGLGALAGVDPQNPIAGRLLFVIFTALCGYWVSKRLAKRKAAAATRQQSAARSRQLLQEAAALA